MLRTIPASYCPKGFLLQKMLFIEIHNLGKTLKFIYHGANNPRAEGMEMACGEAAVALWWGAGGEGCGLRRGVYLNE